MLNLFDSKEKMIFFISKYRINSDINCQGYNMDGNKKKTGSSSDSDEEPKKKQKRTTKGMPIKRFRRIFVGLGVTILVMTPLVTAIIFRTMLDDTIRYVFHQNICQGRLNELRVIQVTSEDEIL